MHLSFLLSMLCPENGLWQPNSFNLSPALECNLQSEKQVLINTKIIDWARVLDSGVAKQQEVSLLCCLNDDLLYLVLMAE